MKTKNVEQDLIHFPNLFVTHISFTFIPAWIYSSLSSFLATKDARREARGGSCIRRLLFVQRGKLLSHEVGTLEIR